MSWNVRKVSIGGDTFHSSILEHRWLTVFSGSFWELEGIDIAMGSFALELRINGNVPDLVASVDWRDDMGSDWSRRRGSIADIFHFGDGDSFAKMRIIDALELWNSYILVSAWLLSNEVVDETAGDWFGISCIV